MHNVFKKEHDLIKEKKTQFYTVLDWNLFDLKCVTEIGYNNFITASI
jgi:hypothetical protein